MATTGTTIINDVLNRIRDVNAQLSANDSPPTTANGRAFVLLAINHASIYVNLALRLLITNGSYAINNTAEFVASLAAGGTANTCLWDMTVQFADYSGRVVAVTTTTGGVTSEIDGPVPYETLGFSSFSWLIDTSPKTTAWAPIGNTLLVIYPVIPSVTLMTAHVYYVQVPTFIAAEANNTAIPDNNVEDVATMTELLMRLKTRQLTDFDNKLKALQAQLGLEATVFVEGGKAA